MPSRRWLITTAGSAALSSCVGRSASPAPSPRPATRLTLRQVSGIAGALRPVEFAVDTDGVWANPFDPAQADLRVTATGPGG